MKTVQGGGVGFFKHKKDGCSMENCCRYVRTPGLSEASPRSNACLLSCFILEKKPDNNSEIRQDPPDGKIMA